MSMISNFLKGVFRGPTGQVTGWFDGARKDADCSDVLGLIRGYSFADFSDGELRDRLGELGLGLRRDAAGDVLPEAYAIVDEAIRRRLGVWRIFEAETNKGRLARYEGLAKAILDARPYGDRIAYYLDSDFLDSPAFCESLAPMLSEMALDDEERAIVKAMVYVAEKSEVAYWPDILLPAEFYAAARAKDADGMLSFVPTDEQLSAGYLLFGKNIVEMDSGEGKTVAAAFPAVLNATAGQSVHIITSNDYLAARDAELMAPVYESLGLTVGSVLGYMGDDERRFAYRQDIVYGTLREFGFDYMRDNLRLPPDRAVQGSLGVAIVDEADHALIDQAGTPLVISGEPIGNRQAIERTRRAVEALVSLQAGAVQGLEAQLKEVAQGSREERVLLAKLLMADPDSSVLRERFAENPKTYKRARASVDEELQFYDEGLSTDLFYAVDSRAKSVVLTDKGHEFLEDKLGTLTDVSELESELASLEARTDIGLEERRASRDRLLRRVAGRHGRTSLVYQMLRAFVLLKRDKDYLVADGRVVLIDELTGRTLPDNIYQYGLHVAIEAKEELVVNPERETLARISVQGFMGRYSQVSGMTGTALDAVAEFGRAYGLRVRRVSANRASRRTDFGARVYRNQADKLAAVMAEVTLAHRVGRPVLVGTLTIEQSQEIGSLLTEQGIPHSLLNAVNNASEAQVVRDAGAFGAVTIATNMAGRGTDIILEPDLNERVVAGYADFVGDLLDGGVGRVELACGSREECRLLMAAFSDDGRYVASEGVGDAIVLVQKAGDGAGGTSVRVEFGLGLYVVGTEMNRSRRIDHQLRGRSGRQGAYGSSRFVLSLDDDFLAFGGDELSFISSGHSGDSCGREYWDGGRVESGLANVQGNGESDDEAYRGLTHQFMSVQEAQAFAYYAARREVTDSECFDDAFYGFAAGLAQSLVERHFPGSRIVDYLSQFDALAEELWVDFEIDCSELEGVGPLALGDEVEDLLLDALDDMGELLGVDALVALGKHLFLQTSDESWTEHVAGLQELMQSVALGVSGHSFALAEFALRGSEAYEAFKGRVSEAFLLRLLNFRLEDVEQGDEAHLELVEDLAEIVL